MSRLYDTIEPSVINEEMLREAVHEQGPKEHAESIAKDEGLNYIDITKLRLDYRSLLIFFHLIPNSCLINLHKIHFTKLVLIRKKFCNLWLNKELRLEIKLTAI